MIEFFLGNKACHHLHLILVYHWQREEEVKVGFPASFLSPEVKHTKKLVLVMHLLRGVELALNTSEVTRSLTE